MRVLYDISVLGLSHFHSRARTGVFRVVDNVARGLAGHPGVALEFCAAHSGHLSLAFHEASAEYAPVPLRVGPYRSRLYRGYNRLSEAVARASAPGALALKVARKPLWLGMRGWDTLSCPVPGRALEGVDLFHSPFFAIPQKIRRVHRLPRVLTVYDLIPIKFPQYFDGPEVPTIRRALEGLDPEDWALCISECTRRDLLEFRPDLDPARVVVTPLAAADHFRPCTDAAQMARVREKYKLPDRPYVLSLCTLEPRKNIEAAVRAFARLAVRGGPLKEASLVLVGTLGWKFGAVLESLEGMGDLRDRVVVTGFAADEDLAAIYSGACMFVYPSRYEGFGLPVLEALQCGVPAISSDVSSLPEVVGDAGLMVPPEDGDALAAAMERVYGDAALRADLSRRALERAAQFSWARTVEETVAVYRKALA